LERIASSTDLENAREQVHDVACNGPVYDEIYLADPRRVARRRNEEPCCVSWSAASTQKRDARLAGNGATRNNRIARARRHPSRVTETLSTSSSFS
jgi:hypothetical protein